VVVCGDSTASGLGLPVTDRSAAYPELLKRALRGEGSRVISHARPGRTIETTLEELDRVVRLDPDVVLVSHGGLENTVRLRGPLSFLPVPPPVRGERRRPLHRLRWMLYRPLFIALQYPIPTAMLQRGGLATSRPVEWIHRDLALLVGELLGRTSAHLVLVSPPTGRMTFQPWRAEGLALLRVFLQQAAAASDRIRLVDLRGAVFDPSMFQADGTHLNAEGHEAAFAIVQRAVLDVLAHQDEEVRSEAAAV
jgi:lysophospholipase L1-like esterase